MRLFSKKDATIKTFDELKSAIRKIISSTILKRLNINYDESPCLSTFDKCNSQEAIENFIERLGHKATLPNTTDGWGDPDPEYDYLRKEGETAVYNCWRCIAIYNDFKRKKMLSNDDKIKEVKSAITMHFEKYMAEAKLHQSAKKDSFLLKLSFMHNQELTQRKIDTAEDVIHRVKNAKSLEEIKSYLLEYQEANNLCEKWNLRGNGRFGEALTACFSSLQEYTNPLSASNYRETVSFQMQ